MQYCNNNSKTKKPWLTEKERAIKSAPAGQNGSTNTKSRAVVYACDFVIKCLQRHLSLHFYFTIKSNKK